MTTMRRPTFLLLAFLLSSSRPVRADSAALQPDGGVQPDGVDAKAIGCPPGQAGCRLLLKLSKNNLATATVLPLPYRASDVLVDRRDVYVTSCISWCTIAPLAAAPQRLADRGYRYQSLALAPDAIYLASDEKELVLIDRQGRQKDRVIAQAQAWALAVDDTQVYFSTGPAIRALPRRGGPVVTLAAGQDDAAALTSDGTRLFWVTSGHGGGASAHPSPNNGTVMAVPVRGGAPVRLASGQPGPGAVAVDDHSVFWVNRTATGYGLARVAKAGGEVTQLAQAPGRPGTRGNRERVIADGDYVYWNAQQRVVRVPKRGGPLETVAEIAGNGDVVNFGMDEAAIYIAAWIYPNPTPHANPRP